MKVQVINGEIRIIGLPQTGTLSDGSTVSGYDLLPPETLAAEGWQDAEDSPPDYDPVTHYLVHEGYAVEDGRAVQKYRVVEHPPKQLTPDERIAKLEKENAQLFDTILWMMTQSTTTP